MKYKLFFQLFFLIKCLEELDFMKITNPEKIYYKIDNEEKEIYLLYINPSKGGEISLEFQNPNYFTTEIYIYSSFSKIKRNDNIYINEDKKFSLKEGNFFIVNSELSNNDKLYIIIKDIKGYFSSNILSIINEMENLEIKLNQPYIIKKFLSKKELNSTFKGEKNMKYSFSFSSKQKFQIRIFDNGNKELLYKSSITEKRDLDKSSSNGIYDINLKNEIDDNPISLIIYENPNFINLKSFIPETLYYNRKINFYFYTKLNNLNIDDENSIIVNIDYNLIVEKGKINFYSKFTNDTNDTLNMKKYPFSSSDKSILTRKKEDDDTIYEIYFKKIDNNNLYLLLTIEIENTNTLLSEKISIELSKYTNLNKELSEYTFKQIFIRRIPQYYKFKKPKNKNKEYIIQSTSSETFSLIYGDLIIKDSNGNYKYNNDISTGQIIKVDNNKTYDILILNLRGYAYTDIYIMEIKKNYIYTFEERPLKIFEYDIGGLENKYLINYYNEFNYFVKNLAVLNFEILSGDCNVYFRNELNGRINEYLPNENDKIESQDFISLKTNIDLFMIKCNLPGKIKLNFISDENTKFQLEDHFIKFFSIKGKIENNIYLPNFSNKKIFFSIESKLKQIITFNFNDKSYKLDINNNFIINEEINIDNSITNVIKLICDNDTIISVFISSENDFQVLKKEDEKKEIKLEKNFILIKLENNHNYKNLNIKFENINSEIFYSLYDLKFDNINYIPYPKGTSNYKILSSSNLIINNPYQFYSKGKLYYYLIIQSENLKDSKIIFSYEEKKDIKNNSVLLNNNETKFEISHDENLEDNLFVFIYTYLTNNNVVDFNLLDKDNIIDSQRLNNGYSIKKYKNLYYDMSISGNFYKKIDFNCIIVNSIYSKENIDLEEFKKYPNRTINYKKNKNSNEINVTWDKIENSIYYVYQIPKNINKENINNDCYLFNLKSKKIISNTIILKEEKDFYFNIVAQIEKYNFRLVYNGIKISIETDGNNRIFIKIIVVIIFLILLLIIIYKLKKRNKLFDDLKISGNLIDEETEEYEKI